MSAQSLQDLIDAAGNPVDLVRNSQIGPYVYPKVPSEFSNWRDEQHAWRDTCCLFDQSHHMTDMYVKGPDALKLLSATGVNSFASFKVDKAKQFVACNHDGQVIGDAILFYLDDNLFNMVGRPSAHNWVQYHAEKDGYDVEIERDERSAVNPGNRKLYRFQVQGPTAMEVLQQANDGALPEIKFFNMGGCASPVTTCARCTTGCPACPASSCSGRGTKARTCARRSSRPARTTGSRRSARASMRRTRSSPAGSPARCLPCSPVTRCATTASGCRRRATRAQARSAAATTRTTSPTTT